MNRKTAILWTLGAGQLLATVIADAISEWASANWIRSAALTVPVSQFYLLGIWIALGGRFARWRLVAVSGLLTCLTWLPDLQLRSLVGAYAFAAFAIPGVLLLLRVFGIQLRCPNESQSTDPRKYQFSIRSALEWTAVIAVLLSLASLLNPHLVVLPGYVAWQGLFFLLGLLHLLFGCSCLAELAILLEMRHPWIGLTFLSPIVIALFALLAWGIQAQIAECLCFGASLILWFAISFYPLRFLGYRFGRVRPTPQQEVQHP